MEIVEITFSIFSLLKTQALSSHRLVDLFALQYLLIHFGSVDQFQFDEHLTRKFMFRI